MIKNDTIYTHPDGNLVLPGITKLVLLRVAQNAGLSVKEEAFTLEDLKKSDEVFASSTTMEAMPITSIDGNPVGTGQRGPVVKNFNNYMQMLQKTSVEKLDKKIQKISPFFMWLIFFYTINKALFANSCGTSEVSWITFKEIFNVYRIVN